MASQYRTISGVKYERSLLDMAEAATKDGRRSVTEETAAKIWADAMDGNRITATEIRTIEYIMNTYRLDQSAKDLLQTNLESQAKHKPGGSRRGGSYSTTIDGIAYKRSLLERAEAISRKGPISIDDAAELWASAHDGTGVTNTERRTLEHILDRHRFTADAEEFLRKALSRRVANSGRPMRPVAEEEAESSWLSMLPAPVAAVCSWLVGASTEKRKRSAEAVEEGGRSGALRKLATGDVATPGASSASSSRDGATHVEALSPELQQLLADQDQVGDALCGAPAAALEWPGGQRKVEDPAGQRAAVAVEVERILAVRSASEILGGGSREEQQREFKRLALLLHPDKGLVSCDDTRARLAWQLVMAALQKARRTV
mmetsp:Transcript_31912/g.67872  ORF Transcript_31912/g.67872 Transcript_31912/m.67872 type:complete len:374 (+) Transcript_31912:68-1189(+)